MIVMVKEKNKLQKKYQLLFQKVLMMVQELDYQEKVKLELGVEQQVICIYSSIFIPTIYSKDQVKIYFLNFQFRLQMQHLEQQSKYQQLMVEKQKLKYQMELKTKSNSD